MSEGNPFGGIHFAGEGKILLFHTGPVAEHEHFLFLKGIAFDKIQFFHIEAQFLLHLADDRILCGFSHFHDSCDTHMAGGGDIVLPQQRDFLLFIDHRSDDAGCEHIPQGNAAGFTEGDQPFVADFLFYQPASAMGTICEMHVRFLLSSIIFVTEMKKLR